MKICTACKHHFDTATWECPACEFSPAENNSIPCFSRNPELISGGFPPEQFAALATLEATNFWFNYRNQLILHYLKKYCIPFNNFLEIGCGTGFVLSNIMKEFPEIKLSGSELYFQGLEYANQRVNNQVNLYQIDARELPFHAEFAVIGAFDVLEHIDDDLRVLKNIHAALKPSGKLILTVPQHKFLWSETDVIACHERRYSQQELISKLAACNFKIRAQTSFVSFLMPIMWLSRLKTKENITHDPGGELKINTQLNYLLSLICKLEYIFIRYGTKFPFGGSLLVVAEKIEEKIQ